MFHVQRYEPHTCLVIQGFGALEMHVLLLSACMLSLITLFRQKHQQQLTRADNKNNSRGWDFVDRLPLFVRLLPQVFRRKCIAR